MAAVMLFRSEVTQLQDAHAELLQIQETVATALDSMGSRVRQGMPVDDDDLVQLEQLEQWQTRMRGAALKLKEDPAVFSLSTLDEAIKDMLSKLAAEEQNTELRRMLTEIAAVPLEGETISLLEHVVQQAQVADPVNMSAETRQAFRALYRVLSMPPHAVETQDFEVVQRAFGLQAALGAASAELASADPRSSAVPASAQLGTPATPEALVPRTIPADAVAAAASVPAPKKLAAEHLEPAGAGSEELELPDPRITAALARGRTGLAYWYAVVLGLPDAVQAAFEVLALSEAITSDGDECSVRVRELLHDFDVTSVAQSPEYLKVLAAGCVRSLLRMPFSPCLAVLQDANALIAEGAFLGVVLHAASFGLELGKLRDEHDRSPAEIIARRDAALESLASAAETARNSRTRYARATHVWRRFVSEKGPLGASVFATLTSPEDLGPAEDLLARLRDQRAVDRLIEETDMQLGAAAARRSRIEARAREELREHTRDLLDALRSYVEAARAAVNWSHMSSSDQLREAIESLIRATADPAEEHGEGAGDKAIGLIKHWLHMILIRHADLPSAQLPVAAVLSRDLSCCFEVRRLEDGTVALGSLTSDVLSCADRPAMQAYEGFVDNDDHIGAEQLIDVLRAEGHGGLADQLANRRQEDLRISRERLSQLLTRTGRELDRALYETLLSESVSAELRAELERLRSLDVNDFVAARDRLEGIIAKVTQARDRAVEEARQQLEGLELPDEIWDRIRRQLDVGDLVNAQEFLAQLAMGAPGLPAEAEANGTLDQFWPSFVDAVAAKGATQSAQAELRWLESAAAAHDDIAGFTLLPPESGSMVERGLRGWIKLTRTKRGRDSGWQESLRDVLNLLGLEVKLPFEQTPHRSQRWWTKIQATLVGQALVPSYGSASAGRYQLLLCWEKATPDRLVELLGEEKPQPPVIALYFGTLPTKDRRRMADYSRPDAKGISAVVIDNAVIAFLTSRAEARLQTTMGITLPFTSINPYRTRHSPSATCHVKSSTGARKNYAACKTPTTRCSSTVAASSVSRHC
jgi:hypothetical protein